MFFKKNKPETAAAEETNDLEPVSDDRLDKINGAGNPWEDTNGVPQQDIDEDLRDRV